MARTRVLQRGNNSASDIRADVTMDSQKLTQLRKSRCKGLDLQGEVLPTKADRKGRDK